MANHKSAERRVRSSKRQAQHNKRWKSLLKSSEKELRKSLEQKDKKQATNQLNQVFSLLDKAKKTKAIHKNRADRKKAQLAKHVNSI